ncbi:MAG: metal-dependent hydrolase [Pirellulaceae bacterium]|nr:metal-dependent hydrolase [Planctomycetales bacterium]MCA9202529.1 metal-dependent hydrolase [Planctomycetales bacterium]
MADFKTHISTSTVIGIGYGIAGYHFLEIPPSTAIVAAGLCGVSGMLPDLDSDSGVPLRETVTFSAAVVPMLMLDRFQQMGLSNESMVLAAGVVYLTIRFVIAEIFRRYTVHRGMWHSIPAAISVGLLAFLIVHGEDILLRAFKTTAVVLGFMVHLLLDEIWSFELRGGRVRIKKSFGTAMKFWGKDSWANFSTYTKLALLAALAASDPYMMENYFHRTDAGQFRSAAREWIGERIDQRVGERLEEASTELR